MSEVENLPQPFRHLVESRRRDLVALAEFPLSEFADIIAEVGFHCDCCARCCTREFNGYVLLLDEDVMRIRSYEPEALEPVPMFDFCDQHGIYYTSGYTIRSMDGQEGPCHFLMERRCRIYERRPAICRVYPYMLQKQSDDAGIVDWRQISGLNLHGEYHGGIDLEEAISRAKETKDFEETVLLREIDYLESAARFFNEHGLRNVRKRYDEGLLSFKRGEGITVRVFHKGVFEQCKVTLGSKERIPSL